jgi:hypothetical protein
MYRKSAITAIFITITAIIVFADPYAEAYRICTFKGTVIDHGWRSMTIKSGTQCAEVNVGWRTKYLPNRRPCIGERVAVDFLLEDGYMKATKIVSLSPLPTAMQCYPPAPPSSAVCRNVEDDGATVAVEGPCASPRAICSNKPPAHVSDPSWSPSRGRSEAVGGTTTPRVPRPSKRAAADREATKPSVTKPAPEPKDETKETVTPGDEKKAKTLTGEVVASSPKSLSVKVLDESDAAEVMNVRVGLKTKFIPFRRPAVGEKVKVEYKQENGDKFGYTVQVVQ